MVFGGLTDVYLHALIRQRAKTKRMLELKRSEEGVVEMTSENENTHLITFHSLLFSVLCDHSRAKHEAHSLSFSFRHSPQRNTLLGRVAVSNEVN